MLRQSLVLAKAVTLGEVQGCEVFDPNSFSTTSFNPTSWFMGLVDAIKDGWQTLLRRRRRM
jgi:hypothetical protein